MKITADNIASLPIGTHVWTCNRVQIPDRYTYIGVQKGDIGEYYMFVNTQGLISISVNHPENDEHIKYNSKLYTTKEECYARLRHYLLWQIDHYNHHQLKTMPVHISDEDLEFMKTEK